MTGNLKVVLALVCLFAACAPARQFVYPARDATMLESAYVEFDSVATTAKITLAFRSETLSGKVRGDITRASREAYRIELTGRGELFLKTYVTRSITVIWPDGASPLVLEDGEEAMLSDIVPGLPDWSLRACLPLLFPSPRSTSDSLLQIEIPRSVEVVVNSPPDAQLVARFSRRSTSLNFPYRKIVIEEPGRQSRLIWKIKP